MAVFTPVSDAQARELLSGYDIGDLVSLSGITQGVENSNFHLVTGQGHYILTLFEGRTDVTALPFYFAYTEHLRQAGIAVPVAVADRRGQTIQIVAGKPAAIIGFLSGRGVETEDITPDLCAQLGDLLGRMHVAGQSFPVVRENTVSLDYWHKAVEKCIPRADEVQAGLAALLVDELAFLQSKWSMLRGLPGGAVHLDLFPDNVFVDGGGQLCGVIDFYFSATDTLLYDFAIVVNAWCFDNAHRLIEARVTALVAAYQKQRSFNGAEVQWMNTALRAASLRFLVSRLHDWLFRPEGAVVTPKDPLEYVAKLEYFRDLGRREVAG